MRKCLAFVLGGGGARGALQVGAIRALVERGYLPDLLVGTSVGAVNATFLALNGLSPESLDRLAEAWRSAISADLLPSNYLWLTVRALFNRPATYPAHRLRAFFVAQGLSPEMRFRDIRGARLVLVAADLSTGRPVLYGADLQQSVLEGVLASTALPPWVAPLEKDGQLLIDGGVISNLPIEPALSQGATEIIALDLVDPRGVSSSVPGFGPFIYRLLTTVEQRQVNLEKALAAARNVPVRHLSLLGDTPVAVWDFRHTEQLIARGYENALQEIDSWVQEERRPWPGRLRRLFSRFKPGGLPPRPPLLEKRR